MTERQDVRVLPSAQAPDPDVVLVREIRRGINGILSAIERWVIARKEQTNPSTR